MLDKKRFYIDGQWIAPAGARELAVIDPSTELPCAVISLGCKRDADSAIAAASAAFDGWSQTPPAARAEAVKRMLAIYERRAPEMAEAIATEMGAPIDMALQKQVGAGYWHICNFLSAFENFTFERPLSASAPNDRIVMDPIGVVGLITPWNWPMNQVTLKVVPALLAGCTMVLKPSEIAPLSSMLFAEMIDEARFPAGVFNLVNGDGAGVGTRLSTHPDVAMISFTGSTRAGVAISEAAAPTLKKVVLELGGKGANVIFADSDTDAVKRGVLKCFGNTGQSCNAPTRMLVERSMYERAIDKARRCAEAVTVDSAHRAGPHLGPLASDAQFQRVQKMIAEGIDEGARVVTGGLGRPAPHERGYFVRPTIFADVTPDMSITREEIFGPVLCMAPFDTEEHAIAIANNTPYGLANYVQSGDWRRAARVAKRLRSGMVEINGSAAAAGSPFGGVKASGRAREGGVWGIEEFLDMKAVAGWRV
ncbi:aldehyde dehydrogenase family protein [Caballeronia sp. GAWG1-1]|uniref:aldehyde dehydrogenase family protein n=1 Tax=Caballeronia sp. GAWG1-1 TaxID=2921742 RepID=UPI00202848CD|nr:aldehyde dehydrogenase family protein [Caballeronia sp. GAWG1-1]